MHLNDELEDVNFIPLSVEVLWFTRNRIIEKDFNLHVQLKEFQVFMKKDGKSVHRRELKALMDGVRFKGDAKW